MIYERGQGLIRSRLGLEALGVGGGPEDRVVWAGVGLAHVAHAAAVAALYGLSRAVFVGRPRIALVAAALHVLSPAGVFLSAPYGESLFAALHFAGYAFYAWSWKLDREQWPGAAGACLLLAGASIGLATTVRSNGLLSGLLFAWDAVAVGLGFLRTRETARLLRLACLVLAGSFVGLGIVVPQFIAYRIYCTGEERTGARPWCSRLVPSIYAFVQDYYWYFNDPLSRPG